MQILGMEPRTLIEIVSALLLIGATWATMRAQVSEAKRSAQSAQRTAAAAHARADEIDSQVIDIRIELGRQGVKLEALNDIRRSVEALNTKVDAIQEMLARGRA